MNITINVIMILGAILITIYAPERFNTPSIIRATTTASRYYAASVSYLATFYIFSKYPDLLRMLEVEGLVRYAGDQNSNESTPLFVALLFSLLVPRFPMISGPDKKLKRSLHRLASIPHEAIRLSKEIQDAGYQPPRPVLESLQADFAGRDIPIDVTGSRAGDPEASWWINITP